MIVKKIKLKPVVMRQMFSNSDWKKKSDFCSNGKEIRPIFFRTICHYFMIHDANHKIALQKNGNARHLSKAKSYTPPATEKQKQKTLQHLYHITHQVQIS